MWPRIFKISKNTVLIISLVTSSFCAMVVLVDLANKVAKTRYPKNGVHSVLRAEVSKHEPIPEARPWKRPISVKPPTSFDTSPYNAVKKRKIITIISDPANPKVIAWQASRTLRVMSTTSDMFQNCLVKDCEVSPSSKSLPRAHAIVFDDGRMNKQTPPQLNDKRVLVYYDMRTSSEVYFKAKGELFSRYWTSVINWVWSYRLNSDIFEPFAYLKKTPTGGKFRQFVVDALKAKSKLAVWINPKVNRKDDSLEDLDKNYHKGKSQTGVEDYMKTLKKHVSFDTVDIISFQTEMNNPETKDSFRMTKYYFMFAFESVHCQDYVSDLFFYGFDPRIVAVPVVRGGVNYTQHFPKGSFINADDFESPKALAVYLKELAGDTRAYGEMLWKKSQYVREDGVNHAWCQLCDMLHRIPRDQTLLERYEDIHAWTAENGKCLLTNTSDSEEDFSSETER